MKTPAHWLRASIKYFQSSISNKIILPYAVLTLIITAFGVYVVTQLVVEGLEERLKNQLVDAGRVVSEEVVNRENLRLEVERLVANTELVPQSIIERDFSELNALVSPYVANSKDIDSIILLDTQGKEMLRLQRDSPAPGAVIQTALGSGVSYEHWSAVAEVLSDPTGSVKDIQLGRDPESGELIIYTVGPVRTSEGIVGAVMVGTYLSKELSTLRSVALTNLILFDSQANIIDTTFALGEDKAAQQVFTPEQYQRVVSNEDVTLLDDISVEAQDTTYRLAYVPFKLRGQAKGVYAVALPTNFITERDETTRNQLIIIFSLGVGAVFGIGYLVSHRIVQPILQLVMTSQAIARGDLTQRTGLNREDEIGTLAKTFDGMTNELQKKTNELEEEASKLSAILSSIANGVLVQDLQGNTVRINPAAEKILQDLASDPAYFPELDTQDLKDRQHPFLTQLKSLQFHEPQRFEAGRRVLSALAAPVVAPDGEQLGSVVVLRDITREVESERLKDDFITSVSHELKTPLTAIKGYLELLKMSGGGKLNERELEWLRSSDKEIGDLNNLIQKMLDLSQIDAGELGTDLQLIDLAELVATETEKWTKKIEERKLSLEITIPEEPIWIEGDWDKLTRVVYNLIENAQNYTLPGGHIYVRVKSDNSQVRVEVQDTGVGIDQKNHRFLFTRFFRAIHEESTFEISGAGLGLYMSKAFVEAHPDGKMGMESEIHQGSTFYFILPLANPMLDEFSEKPVEYLPSEHLDLSS